MIQDVVLNGRQIGISCEPSLVVNNSRHQFPTAINGKRADRININGYDYPPVDPSCVLYYPGLPATGSTIIDCSKNSYNGTIVGATWARTPLGIWHLKHDGSDDYVNCGVAVGNAFGNGVSAIAIELWFKANVTNDDDGLFDFGAFAGSPGEILCAIAGNKLYLHLSAASFSQSITFTDTSKWHHLIGQYTGAAGVLCLDGVVRINSAHATDLNLAGLKPIVGGYYSNVYCLNGRTALFRVHNTTLSSATATNHFQVERCLFGV